DNADTSQIKRLNWFSDDIAFHFNPRFNEDGNQVIVRTTRIEGVWGPEERELPFFPFSPGKPFEVSVVNSQSSGIYRCWGDYLPLLGRLFTPAGAVIYRCWSGYLPLLERLFTPAGAVIYPCWSGYLPLLERLFTPAGAGIYRCWGFVFSSIRFAIDICKGDDVAFNFNPRFNEDGKQVIVRTTRIRDVWGPEERELPFFPFSPGKPFEIKIFCTSSDYRVEVDGKHLLNYGHRMKQLDQITHLYIQQDVVLKYVRIGM
uniref:Galectin n=1 Tax=Pygocentrus nattereri TaxID=42514 RepID=A0AAR2J3V6_PYGNA